MDGAQRHDRRNQAQEAVAFGFGFFAMMLPCVAVVVGVVGVVTGLATSAEALITVALMLGLYFAMLHDKWTISALLYRAIVTSTAEVAVLLSPVPAASNLAELLATWIVLWL